MWREGWGYNGNEEGGKGRAGLFRYPTRGEGGFCFLQQAILLTH